MGFWEFLATVVAIEAFVRLVKMKHDNRRAYWANNDQNAALAERMEKLERRMANLETIVLESEKHREFERAL